MTNKISFQKVEADLHFLWRSLKDPLAQLPVDQEPNYISELPSEIIQNLLNYCPLKVALVNKEFHKNLSALKFTQYTLLKNSENCPKDLSDKLVQIEKDLLITKNGHKLVAAFFSTLWRPENSGAMEEFNCCDLQIKMITAWEADKVQQDDCLVKCWSKIAPLLNVNPNMPANEIRNWINNEENQVRLTQIDDLDLSCLELTLLPSEITHLKGLKNLDISFNSLKRLPTTLGNLNKLTKLNIGENKLGSLPIEIEKLTELRKLDLSNNSLKKLPAEIVKLQQLALLELSSNCFEELPDTITQLSNLKVLNVDGNKLKELPKNLGNLVNLVTLNIQENKITHLSEEAFGKLFKLTLLDASNNQLKELPSTLTSLKNLNFLKIKNNQLSHLPENFGNLINLSTLLVNGNQLIELSNEELKKLSKLTELNLSSNLLSEIPNTIPSLTKLSWLNLGDNKFTQLPENMGKLVNLEELSILVKTVAIAPASLADINEETQVEIHWHTMLVIPECVVERFKEDLLMQQFITLRKKECHSPLDQLSQFIRKSSDTIFTAQFEQEKGFKLINALDESDKEYLYSKLSIKENPERLFDDKVLFVSALHELKSEKGSSENILFYRY